MWASDPCPSPWGLFREAKKTCPGERQVLGERGRQCKYIFIT